ncbi:hypothetical protein, partial [Serratia marcescens]
RESLDSRPGFFICMAHRREGCAQRISPRSVTAILISAGYPRTLPLIFSPIHDICPAFAAVFSKVRTA